MSRTRLVTLLLVLGTLAVYLPVAHCGFSTFDDGDYVTGNSMVYNGLTLAGVRWAFTSWYASNWHPLTWLSHMLDCEVLGLNPGPQHVVNVLFHAANAILVFVLLRRWLPDGWVPAMVAALFAWHPMHVESVAWISERKDVLSTFFALLALLCYTRYVCPQSRVQSPKSEKHQKATVDCGLWTVDYFASLIFFTCALLSKPMFVTLPFVMLLLDYWPLRRVQGSKFKVQSLVVEKIPFFLLSVGSCIVTFVAQQRGGMVASLERLPLSARLENVPVNYISYLAKLFWPAHLTIYYPPAPVPVTTLVIALVILISISFVAWRMRATRPYLLFGWFWFLGTLVPVIGLVQVGMVTMADRYAYFPSIGLFLAVIMGLADLVRRFQLSKAMVTAPAAVVLVGLLWLAHIQVGYWRNDVALFSHALDLTKEDETLRLCLGLAYERSGDLPKAIAQYEAAVKLEPGRARTHSALANALAATDRPEAALPEFDEALRLAPGDVPTLNNYGKLLFRLRRFDDAMAVYSRSVQLDPANWRTPFLMARLRFEQGRVDESISLLQTALRDDPGNPTVQNLLERIKTKDLLPPQQQ